VNAASAGDMIIVRDGSYNESVKVNKSLTIVSENGADSTIVHAANSTDYVFELIAEYVTLSGFTIEKASDCGILISRVNNCNISNNIVSSNFQGIYLANSSQNIISNNTAKNNGNNGIYLQESNSNVIYLNNFMNNSCNVYSSNSTNIWNSTSTMTYIYNGTEYKKGSLVSCVVFKYN
jgi:parallel beta-helix repeat protein